MTRLFILSYKFCATYSVILIYDKDTDKAFLIDTEKTRVDKDLFLKNGIDIDKMEYIKGKKIESLGNTVIIDTDRENKVACSITGKILSKNSIKVNKKYFLTDNIDDEISFVANCNSLDDIDEISYGNLEHLMRKSGIYKGLRENGKIRSAGELVYYRTREYRELEESESEEMEHKEMGSSESEHKEPEIADYIKVLSIMERGNILTIPYNCITKLKVFNLKYIESTRDMSKANVISKIKLDNDTNILASINNMQDKDKYVVQIISKYTNEMPEEDIMKYYDGYVAFRKNIMTI